jgi:hypothetical protein
MRKTIAMASVLGILVMAVGLPSLAGGKGNLNPGVMPPQSKAFGKTYGEWGAAWQQWAFNTTTENCPVTDTTGERALVGQSGQVYFLAGTFGQNLGTPWEAPNPVTRNVTIPAGTALCMPINNWGLVYPEDNPFAGVPADATTWEEAMPYFYAALNAAYDNTPESCLVCEVDGVTIKNLRSYRAQSEPFMIYAPAVNVQNDLMDYFVYGEIPPPPGTFYAEGWHHSVSDGYYVILAPLSAGQHTIHMLTGWLDEAGVLQVFCDTYYNLTVQAQK